MFNPAAGYSAVVINGTAPRGERRGRAPAHHRAQRRQIPAAVAVTVGAGAKAGANTVVVHGVPPHATAVGIPARVVRQPQPALATSAG
ncbi:MAG: hypothetical protein ACJ8F7_23090 [Gemmataceae bacterium]